MNPAHSPACSDYVGVPYLDLGRSPEGWDCYGLVYYLSRFVLHRAVPSYSMSYGSATDNEHVSSAIEYHCREWVAVAREDIKYGDVLVFNIAGLPVHCGLALDNCRMLHCLAGHETVIVRFDSAAWTRRLVGVYRWT